MENETRPATQGPGYVRSGGSARITLASGRTSMPGSNRKASMLLCRDIDKASRYFSRQGVQSATGLRSVIQGRIGLYACMPAKSGSCATTVATSWAAIVSFTRQRMARSITIITACTAKMLR